MPPATLPNVLAAPEMTDESLFIKPPETGIISPEPDELILVGSIDKGSFVRCPFAADVVALEILGSSAADDTEGLINAAIENNDVA